MKFADLENAQYTRKEEITEPMTVTVVDVWQVTFESPGEEPRKKPVFKFAELEKPVVIAPSNVADVHEALGTNPYQGDTSDWFGKKLVLWNDPTVKYQGKRTGGLRLRRYVPPASSKSAGSSPAQEVSDNGSIEALENDIPI